jgi:RluA family pseudouridine synthase
MFIQQALNAYKNIDILFENNDFIVVNKPHGMAVVKGRNRIDDIVLFDALLAIYKRLYLVHRLDAGTGGLMVLAKNKKFCLNLTREFEKHKVIKKYLCICDGILETPVTLMLPISKRNYKGLYKVNFKSGKKSITSFYPVAHYSGKSIVLATPLTGRTHQIRVHLKSMKIPIIGDYIYNKGTVVDNQKKIPLYAFYLQFEKYSFQAKPSEYFFLMATKYNLDKILKQFYEKLP